MNANNAQRMADRTFSNPIIGDEVTVLVEPEETGGAYEQIEIRLVPGGGNTLHYHTEFEETFEAVEGVVHLECEGKMVSLKPGDKFVVRRNKLHRFFNPGKTPIAFLVEMRPAINFPKTLRIAYGLARDGKVNPKTNAPRNLLELAVLFQYSETYLPKIPLFVQKSMSFVLYRIAKWSGVEKRLIRTYLR